MIATGYGLALLLLILPLLEPVVTLLPVRPEQLRWRLEAFGVFSQSLLLPLVGAAVAIATAVLLDQRRVVRMLSALAWVVALLLSLAATLFVLDLLQYRPAVGPELREYYEVAGVIYFASPILAAVFLLWLGAVGWRAGNHPHRHRRRRARSLLVTAAAAATEVGTPGAEA